MENSLKLDWENKIVASLSAAEELEESILAADIASHLMVWQIEESKASSHADPSNSTLSSSWPEYVTTFFAMPASCLWRILSFDV